MMIFHMCCIFLNHPSNYDESLVKSCVHIRGKEKIFHVMPLTLCIPILICDLFFLSKISIFMYVILPLQSGFTTLR